MTEASETPGTHQHGDMTYANPDELGSYNDEQLMGLQVLNDVVRGVYGVAIDPLNHMHILLVDFEYDRMIDGMLTEDGDIVFQGEQTLTLLWGFASISHEHLANGPGNELFHTAMSALIDKFMEDEIKADELISLGRQLGMVLGLIPADADTRNPAEGHV